MPGFQVVRYDHRDAGLSTHFTGRKRAYELTDMIDDMMAVLDAMGWESANLAGLSSGGGLAQFAALRHPERVRTMTAISAIPQYGNQILHVPLHPLSRTVQAGLPPLRRQPRGEAADADRRHPAGRGQEPAAGRGMGPAGRRRNPCAATTRTRTPAPASSPRAARRSCPTGGIAGITQPVLAINGDEDPLVRPAAGRKIAETVQRGRFVLVHRMGHLFSEPLWPQLVSEIGRHAA